MTPLEFWTLVPVSDVGCWEWQGPRRADGYGLVRVNRRTVRAHRQSWELINGPIPKGLCILHRCDNPPCVRPDHLFLGTMADNTHDMMRKGRHSTPPHARGERHHNSHISEAELIALRAAHRKGQIRVADEARRHGMSETALYRALAGGSYRHLNDRVAP